MKTAYDLPIVQVNGSIDKALRDLKRRMDRDGVFKRLKLRNQWPTTSARRKAKRLASAGRRRLSKKNKDN